MSLLVSSSRLRLAFFSAVLLLAASVLGILVFSVLEASDSQDVASAWNEHRDACLGTPIEEYLLDRARGVRGFVCDSGGKPLPGALVRCIRSESLLRVTQAERLAPESWAGLVETEVLTDSEGRYEFAHLSEGARMLCVSASGFAPSSRGFVVVQDGAGARADFELEAPQSLRVRIADFDDRPRRVFLVPHRWWPGLMSQDCAPGSSQVEFTGVGGPFKKGLVVIADSADESIWKPAAPFDLSRSSEVTATSTGDYVTSARDVPEAQGILDWHTESSDAVRSFFSMVSPLALFWGLEPNSRPAPLLLDLAAGSLRRGPGMGALRGYGGGAFLPVLIERRDGAAWLEWTSDASEFEIRGIPEGVYRVRSLNSYGRITFASGAVLPDAELATLASRPSGEIQLDDDRSREVQGIVRWKDGRPAVKAAVFLQDATNFRRFLQRVETNANGFFRVSNVPVGTYVAFTLPPKDDEAMKSFLYPQVRSRARETWLDLTLFPHRVTGRLPAGREWKRAELARADSDNPASTLWSVVAGSGGAFEISNVPPGKYVVRAVSDQSTTTVTSISFEVRDESTVTVRWP